MTWAGIVGKGFTAEQFDAYVLTLHLGIWHPQFIVLHNTGAPTFAQWHSTPGEQRMQNLEHHYRDEEHWSAGPHLFIADDLIWVFTPLIVPGVHSPSWNKISWGVEIVGNYEIEFLGDAVRNNTVKALTALCRLGSLLPQGIRLHKEDPLTTHNCPGKNVIKADIISQVLAEIAPSLPPDLGGEIAT